MQFNFPHSSRLLSRAQLHRALIEARSTTKLFLSHWRALTGNPRAHLPLNPEWNLPEWEAGHIAWFQEFWIARNPDRSLGWNADPNSERYASLILDADTIYHSSLIAHDPRWNLPFPDVGTLERYLDEGLEQTLTLLNHIEEQDISSQNSAALYFFQLALYHEDMHAEAAHYSINHYLHDWGTQSDRVREYIGLHPDSLQTPPSLELFPHALSQNVLRSQQIAIQAGERLFGAPAEMGFAFDNELPPFINSIAHFSIDTAPVSVFAFLQFMQSGGYQNRNYWSDTGWAWKIEHQLSAPRFHRLKDDHIERCCFGSWEQVPEHSPIMHVSAYEAEAWCAWAERRLPTEYEWTVAATQHPDLFHWGEVWEWTHNDFVPFDGFITHPYRDYSQPWFTGHRVLKGASFATHSRMRHPVYRNFYVPGRNDIYCGFRTCAR